MAVAAPKLRVGGGVDLTAIIAALDTDEGKKLAENALAYVADQCWFPTPGPQTEAYFSKADEIFYGGAAGGGKTDLIVGLATTAHRRSVLVRRQGTDLGAIEERLISVAGRVGYNSQPGRQRMRAVISGKRRLIELTSCPHEKDKAGFQGQPRDFYGIDEICQFTESQYTYMIGWNRPGSGVPETQRCRIVCTGNPPDTPEGEWVRVRWAPWLDPQHPNPALDGELRWFTNIDGKDTEVSEDWRGVDEFGDEIKPRSRTFIHANLRDNPYLGAEYRANIASMPEPYRSQLLNGDFQAGVKDHDYQIIPTANVNRAIELGKQRKALREAGQLPRRVMTSLGLDCALGGKDNAVLAPVYDNREVGELKRKPGKEIEDGTFLAAFAIQHHKDHARLAIDMGGGYGDSCYTHVKDILVPEPHKYVGSKTSTRLARVTGLKFSNMRSECLWRVREMLDPENPENFDCEISLPDDAKMKADLCAVRFKVRSGVIHAEPKEDLCIRIGRSTDDGDAVMIALCAPVVHPDEIAATRQKHLQGKPGGRGMLKVKVGYEKAKRRG